jgi:DNA repair protein RecN (Recombination protein N)
MLDELVVRNIGLIEETRVCPGRGLVVVSGETGTGKTMLLGALRLLLGADARPDLVGPFGDETVVEGRFLIDGEEVVAGRRLLREGRSRAYLNGSLASGKLLEERVGSLVEIIGQNDQVFLTRQSEVRSLVDGLLDSEGLVALDAYRSVRKRAGELERARTTLGGDVRALARELDLTRFQAEEIAGAGFSPGDADKLEKRAQRLRNAEALASHLHTATSFTEASSESLGEAVSEVRKGARLDRDLESLAGESGEAAEILRELGRSIRLAAETISADPEALTEVEQRLTLLGDLCRKYGPTLDDVLAFGVQARRRSEELAGLLSKADSIDSELVAAQAEVGSQGTLLAEARRRAAGLLAKGAMGHLRELGLTDPIVSIEVLDGEPTAAGADQVKLLFASDRRLQLGEVSKVASGGELSRLVLSLRLAARAGAGKDMAAVLVFDEIDAGVGGTTALELGRKLGTLASDCQVLCVTHLPQVAAFADSHFVVERSDNRATVREIDGEERIAELSRMLAGLPESSRGREAAAELVAIARGEAGLLR